MNLSLRYLGSAVVVCFVALEFAQAGEYHVSKTGSDEASGTGQAPYRTLA